MQAIPLHSILLSSSIKANTKRIIGILILSSAYTIISLNNNPNENPPKTIKFVKIVQIYAKVNDKSPLIIFNLSQVIDLWASYKPNLFIFNSYKVSGEDSIISQQYFIEADNFEWYDTSNSNNADHIVFGEPGQRVVPLLELHVSIRGVCFRKEIFWGWKAIFFRKSPKK